jgi:hypothetical protein
MIHSRPSTGEAKLIFVFFAPFAVRQLPFSGSDFGFRISFGFRAFGFRISGLRVLAFPPPAQL